MSTVWSLCPQNVVSPYNGLLFSHQKEQRCDTCCEFSMDGLQKHDANLEKPDAEVYTAHDSISMKRPENVNL